MKTAIIFFVLFLAYLYQARQGEYCLKGLVGRRLHYLPGEKAYVFELFHENPMIPESFFYFPDGIRAGLWKHNFSEGEWIRLQAHTRKTKIVKLPNGEYVQARLAKMTWDPRLNSF